MQAWLVIWFGNFTVIEDGVGLLGVVTLAFVVAAWRLQPPLHSVATGFIPSLPNHDLTRYAFLTVSIVGATVSPYLLNFYSSGAIEEKWTEPDLWINRVTCYFGMGFGSIVSMGVLITAAVVLGPLHVQVNSYSRRLSCSCRCSGAGRCCSLRARWVWDVLARRSKSR